MAPLEGFAPSFSGFKGRRIDCSATGVKIGGPGETCTLTRRIKSPLLPYLSYGPDGSDSITEKMAKP